MLDKRNILRARRLYDLSVLLVLGVVEHVHPEPEVSAVVPHPEWVEEAVVAAVTAIVVVDNCSPLLDGSSFLEVCFCNLCLAFACFTCLGCAFLSCC